jgi:hypothetical protein
MGITFMGIRFVRSGIAVKGTDRGHKFRPLEVVLDDYELAVWDAR